MADANFPRAAAALQHNLRSAVAFPLLRGGPGGEVFAVAELFTDHVLASDTGLLSVMGTIGVLAGAAAAEPTL